MKISVLGCGRWGTFIAWYLDSLEHEVSLWGRSSSKNMEQLIRERKNSYLTLTDSISLTSDIETAINTAEVVVISISAQQLRSFLTQIKEKGLKPKTLVLCMKGLENTTGKRLTEVVEDIFGDEVPCAVWVGPGHVQDYTKGIPNCMVIDSKDEELTKRIVDCFSSKLIRFYYGCDLIGSEIGAAAKNVIGIAAGVLDGMNLTSLKGALMARGTKEVSRLIVAMGGHELTAYGLAHLGDYEATVFSEYSQNRRYGEMFVKNEESSYLAEGVATTKALMYLQEKYAIELPISTAVYDLIEKKMPAKEVIDALFLRSIKDELS